jgi:hypothetical protein
MRKQTATLIFPFILLVILAGSAVGAPGKVAQVVYITLSKACGCTLERCQAGNIVMENLFNGDRKGLLKRIDYATDKEAASVYIKRYHITQAPALLFLDAQGNLLWTKAGELNEKEIADKLSQFGG